MTTVANPVPGRELSGKVVRVTGAARNIGREIARAFAAKVAATIECFGRIDALV